MSVNKESPSSFEEKNANPIVRILLTESETQLLYDKPSTTRVFYRQQSTSFENENDQEEETTDAAERDKTGIFTKDQMTQTQQSDCFVVMKHKSTNYNG